MNLFSRVLAAFGVGRLANPDIGIQQTGPTSRGTSANITVNDDRALAVSAVWACVQKIVQPGATLPLGFFARTDTGREALPEDNPLCRLLKYRPNQYMTGLQFRQAMWTQRVIWGNAYARIDWSGDEPAAITPLKPEHVTVERTAAGTVYKYSSESETVDYDSANIMHWKGWGPDGVVGLSPLSYARQALGISVSADNRAANSFRTLPAGALKFDKFLTDEQRAKARQLYAGLEATAENPGDGSPWLLEGGSDFVKIMDDLDKLQMLQSRQFQVADLCRFFGVPAVMVDGNAGATSAWPASFEQQVLSFLTFTLKEYFDEFEDAARSSLIRRPADQRSTIIEHNVEGFLRADSSARSGFYATALQNGWMNRDEVRAKENLPPLPDGQGQEYTVQTNLAPIFQLGDPNAEQT